MTTINSSPNRGATLRPSNSVVVSLSWLLAIFLYNFQLFLYSLRSVDTLAHLRQLRRFLNSDMISRTSTCIRCPPPQESIVLNISVFPSSSFVSVCSLSLPSDACQWHGSALRVVLAIAVALFLCVHSQHLILLWSLPLLWTTLPPSPPKFGYTSIRGDTGTCP